MQFNEALTIIQNYHNRQQVTAGELYEARKLVWPADLAESLVPPDLPEQLLLL